MWRTRMNWATPFDRGDGRIRRGRGIAIGFKGITAPTTSVAIVNLYGDGSCALYIGTVDMGQGSDTVMAQIAGRGAQHRRGRDPRHASRHRCHAVRHGHARLALDVPHGHGGAARGRGRQAKDRRARAASSACRRAATCRSSELLRRKYGMQAGNIIGTGSFIPDYEKPDSDDRPVEQSDAVLGRRRDRRRGRGRHRDRPVHDDEARQRRRRRHRAQSEARAGAALRRRHHAARLHHDGRT